MVAVREIQTRDIHASINHPDEHVSLPAGRSEGNDNLSLTMGQVNLLKDALEVDPVGVRGVVCINHGSIFGCLCSFFKSESILN